VENAFFGGFREVSVSRRTCRDDMSTSSSQPFFCSTIIVSTAKAELQLVAIVYFSMFLFLEFGTVAAEYVSGLCSARKI
jgi:hypothetical protein